MKPITSRLILPEGTLTPHQNHVRRTLSSMRGQFMDECAYESMLEIRDTEIYEVYENASPETTGELRLGTSIVHPGKVGEEYFMTKGHFHEILETAEVYYCLSGHGYMMMETPEGQWAAEELVPGTVLYVPPSWAHRSINIGSEDLITFFVFPSNAGHDYGTIESRGFRKLIVERQGKLVFIENPRWRSYGS